MPRSSRPGRGAENPAGGPLASYAVLVTDAAGTVVAQAQAMAYRRKDPLPGLEAFTRAG